MQPPNSGAPPPVFGVIGGPGLGGSANIDGGTGNIVLSPAGNATQLKSGDNPQALQIYEYDRSATDYSRLSIHAQVGGPFVIAVETDPPTVQRGLVIRANGPVSFDTTGIGSLAFTVNAPASTSSGVQLNTPGSFLYSGTGVPAPTLGVSGDYYFRTDTPTTSLQRIYTRDAVGWVGVV